MKAAHYDYDAWQRRISESTKDHQGSTIAMIESVRTVLYEELQLLRTNETCREIPDFYTI